MAPRPRILAFGSAAAVVVAGSICAALVSGVIGEGLAIALITLGLGAVVGMILLEVGLSGKWDLREGREAATAACYRCGAAASASPLAPPARLRIGPAGAVRAEQHS